MKKKADPCCFFSHFYFIYFFQSTDVDHLSLHVMVRALDTPDKQDLRKLQLLKDELVSRERLILAGCFFSV